ncbi:MAG TPA: metallophosphoesterase [Candidatus Aquilonibacter sp.]|nr:metallophosphoesterase [Candidatus Aquilonibacter sp.]
MSRKNLGNFAGMAHSGLGAHFRAGGSAYSAETYGPLKALLPDHLAAWISHVARFWFHKKHKFREYSAPDEGTGVVPIADHATLSIAGDWGTGTDEAEKVAQRILEFAPDYTIHLGDVYFVGDKREVKENFLGEKTSPYEPVKWPMGRIGSFALSGNHEMYARGYGYFESILPKMGLREPGSYWGSGQRASFFCLENKFWRIIGLDTGYNSTAFDWGRVDLLDRSKWLRKSVHFKPKCNFPDPMMGWLADVVQPEVDGRGLILLTHHGCYSAFSEWYQIPARQLAAVIRRPVIWFWGHEHRLTIYDRYSVRNGISAYGRCIGHAGMPVDRGKPDLDAPWLAYDNRRYRNDENIDVGFNGHANLRFDGPEMRAEYLDLNGATLFTESWHVDLPSGKLHGPNLTKVLDDPALHFKV